MPNVSYPLDTTGLSPANKVVDEPHVLTEVNDATYRTFVPVFAPFYQDNFVLKSVDTLGNESTLQRDIDYVLTLPYLSASRSIGKMVWGGVAINSSIVNGSLKMTYQTLGGDYVADADVVREKLWELAINPRVVSWEVIANKPELFPPINHDHDLSDMMGTEEVVEAINNVAEAVLQGPSVSNPYVGHLTDEDNPHNTNKQQIGLGDVENLPMATDQEVIARAPVDKYITLRQLLLLLPP